MSAEETPVGSETQRRLRHEAARQRMSESPSVGDLSCRRATTGRWPDKVLALAGAMPDFPDAEQLRIDRPADAGRLPW